MRGLFIRSIVLYAILVVLQSRFITPILHSYIALSTSNPQLQTVYNFTFILPSGLPADGRILIQFPEESYNAGLATSPSGYKLLMFNTDITSNVTLSDRTFTIKPALTLAANSQVNISIDSLYNPSKSGGTGNFRIFTFDNQTNLIDESDSFGTIGFTDLAEQLQDLQVWSSDNFAGNSINYTVGFTSLQTIQQRPQLTIQFPSEYKLDSVSSCFCQNINSKVVYSSQKNALYISGFGALTKGTYLNCTIVGVQNPGYQVIAGLVDVSLGVEDSVAVTQSGYTDPVYIQANSIGLAASTNQSLYSNLNRTIVLTLNPTNSFAALKLVTPFRPLYNVSVQCGLAYTQLNTTILFNIVQLTNFTAAGTSAVNISLTGIIDEQLGNMQTIMIQAYSYLDSSFQFLVDYSNSSDLTELTPQRNITVMTGTTVTTSSLLTLNFNVVILTVKTPSIDIISSIDLEMAEFSNLTLCKVNGSITDCQLLNDTVSFAELNMPVSSSVGIVVELHLYNPRLATSLPIGVAATANPGKVYYQSLKLNFAASSFPALSLQPIYGIGFKVVLNLMGLVAIQGNNISSTDYQRHSYINITGAVSTGAYSCNFSTLFISNITTQLSGAWCKFVGNSILVGGYQSMDNLTDVEFVVLSSNALPQTYTIQLRQAIQNISMVVASGTSSIAVAAASPGLVRTFTKSNMPFMSTLSYNFTFNASDYLLIQLPGAVGCCSQVYIDSTTLATFSYVNTSTGIMINTSNLTTGVHNLSLVNIDLTSGYASGGIVKVTEFTGQLATSQHQLTIQTTTFIEGSWRLLLSDSSAGFPYANYTFTFNTTSSPFAETDLLLTFSSANYPFAALPGLEQLLINGIYQKQLPTLALSASGQLRIGNMAYGRANGTIWFTLFGIANPSTSGPQIVQIVYLDKTNFQYASANVSFTIGSVQAANANAFILGVVPNSTTLHEVMIITVPFTFLPSQTKLSFEFSHVTLGSTTWLSASQYIYFSISSASVLTSTVMSHISTPDQSFIRLLLYNWTLTSSTFSLKVTLQYRTTAFYQQTANAIVAQTTTPQSCIASLSFHPQNAAEVSTYDFTLKQVQLQQGQRLYFGFGPEFLSGLSPRLLDIASPQLAGPISSTAYEEMIVIDGFYNQSKLQDTNISIFGIVNPNRKGLNLTSSFIVYVLGGDSAISHSCTVPGVQLTVPPTVMQLSSITTSNGLSRYTAVYNFTFTVTSMPSAANGGSLFIDFPEQYWVDAFSSCAINSSFSLDSYCSLRGYRLTLHTNNEQNITSSTLLTASISGIRNPQFQGDTGNFVVGVYNDISRTVVQRTYGNVNPTYISSSQRSEEILVNNLEPLYIERGVLSDTFSIAFQSPAKVPVTLIPNVLSKEVVVIPNYIQVQIGDGSISFRLASSKYISQIRLQLNWTKTNDNVQEVYMPLYRSPIYLATETTIKLVDVGFPLVLYQNGSSFGYSICVSNPPYNTLEITVATNNSCTVVGTIQPITLLRTCTRYQLNCPISTSQGTAQLTYSNNQEDIYQFASKIVQPTVVPYSSDVPTVNSLAIVAFTRTTVTVQVDSAQTMKIYYVAGDCGYAAVSFLDVFNQNGTSATLNWSNPAFSILQVSSGVANHTVTGLYASHCYQFTFYQVSMFSVQNDTAIVKSVTTAASEASMKFVLQLRQSQLLPSFQEQYLRSMATLMAVPTVRVITDYCNRTVWDGTVLWWNLILLADPANENSNIEPAQLLAYLSSSIDTLNTYVPKLVVETIRMASYTSVSWSPTVVNAAHVNTSVAELSIAGPSCLTLALTANVVNATAPTIYSTFYQTASLLKPGNQPSQFQLDSILNGTSFTFSLVNLISQTTYRVEFIMWRPELQHDIASTPTVLEFSTAKVKQAIDLTSIFVTNNVKHLEYGFLLLVLLFQAVL